MSLLYRKNVAAIFQNQSGQILVLERINHPGAWQFPQGGVDEGESYLQALFREMEEELSVIKDQYAVLSAHGYYRYEFPDEIKVKFDPNVGQEQVYFHCVVNDAFEINLDTKVPEFSQYMWVSVEDFSLDWVPEFKQSVYKKAFKDLLGKQLSSL